MATQGISWLLRLYVLLLLASTLDPSSYPPRDTVPLDVLLEDLEQQDSLGILEVLSWSCSALGVLINGVFLGWHIGKRLKRHWREEKGHAALGTQGNLLPGTLLVPEADPLTSGETRPDEEVPAPLLSSECIAGGEDKKEKGDLEEEETPLLPSTMDPWLQHGPSPHPPAQRNQAAHAHLP
ncbi:hypothetical protein WISP_55114 [Willisornis vidua]|uniref:Uncharacterized protein n=1 Tax=Willisornis vidua TaxID=1566151 RepID=A0ABQ9DF90_9PASS|nr:hypothetical protein WISP_55114 [Willisornis vidua]